MSGLSASALRMRGQRIPEIDARALNRDGPIHASELRAPLHHRKVSVQGGPCGRRSKQARGVRGAAAPACRADKGAMLHPFAEPSRERAAMIVSAADLSWVPG